MESTLTEARAKLAELQEQAREQERVIAEEELRQAEEKHAPLIEQCRTLQERFDALDRQVHEQTPIYTAALTRRNGANVALDTERRNRPSPDWDNGRAYREPARSEYEARIAAHVAEVKAAEAGLAPAFAELNRLQGERRAVSSDLQKASWEESAARQTVTECRRNLAKLVPRSAVISPWQEQPVPENLTVIVGDY